MTYKTNITKKDLIDALNYMKKHNLEVATIEFINNPIGVVVLISKNFDSKQTDITNYDSW